MDMGTEEAGAERQAARARDRQRELAIEWGVCLDGHVVHPFFAARLEGLLRHVEALEDRVRELEGRPR
jgi:hypothetical protein